MCVKHRVGKRQPLWDRRYAAYNLGFLVLKDFCFSSTKNPFKIKKNAWKKFVDIYQNTDLKKMNYY